MKWMIFIIFSMILTACSQDHEVMIPLTESSMEEKTVQEDTRDHSVNSETEAPLVFAVASILSIKEMNERYGELADYLENHLDREIELVQRQTYGEIEDLFESGEADFGFVCAYLTVIGDEKNIMERLAVPVINGDTRFTSYIIVNQETDATSVNDLEGLRFAYSDRLSYSGFLYPNYRIHQEGFDPESFFERTYFTYSHDNTISAVANGLVDAGATHSHVYERMVQDGSPLIDNVRIIETGYEVGNTPFIVHPELDQSLKEDLSDVLLTMNDDPMGQSVLKILGVDWFKSPNSAPFYPIYQMMEALEVQNE